MQVQSRSDRLHRTRVSAVDRLEYFLRSRASKVVVLALVANTMVASYSTTPPVN
jgi:hypothetical protein